ncbi:serine protease [Pleionea sp. CnH1-48]|uniref:S1 family peptidase n=1 Tax=Pleionea sp. CnH1-48 TaxID=2954494 RepID=UPI00209688B9|nr:serine protease [Pleionea sp. CnH1-48]MCO7223697.1 serine protease [Pleionea sp. CnH1-48]
MRKLIFFGVLIGMLAALWPAVAVADEEAQSLFSSFRDRLYQIRTIDNESGSKSSIGSAFAINDKGSLVTNYHVISNAILRPDKYHLEALNSEGKSLPIVIDNIDVINDLARVSFKEPGISKGLKLATAEPQQGEAIYSLGNPRDLGMTVVPGTYNGYTSYSYYDRILFSGSVNPGMSGGPVLNHKGEVVGVNVATSGNQISFLVPLKKLQILLNNERDISLSLATQAYKQLVANQQTLMQSVLDGDWNRLPLGEAKVVGELTDFISCWGDSSVNEMNIKEVYRRCRNQEYIYIAPAFHTGILEMEFFWYESEAMSSWQFYRILAEGFHSVSAGNVANQEDVTEFECNNNFVTQSKEVVKVVYCVRAYKQFKGLFDVLYLAMSVSNNNKSLISHYTLAGVEKKFAQSFLQRFMDHL